MLLESCLIQIAVRCRDGLLDLKLPLGHGRGDPAYPGKLTYVGLVRVDALRIHWNLGQGFRQTVNLSDDSERLLSGLREHGSLAFLFHLGLLLGHRERVLLVQLRAARVLVIALKRVGISENLWTLLERSCLGAWDVLNFQISRKRVVLSFCIGKHSKALSVSLSASDVLGSQAHLVPALTSWERSRLTARHWTDLTHRVVLVSNSIDGHERVGTSLDVSLVPSNVVVVDRREV